MGGSELIQAMRALMEGLEVDCVKEWPRLSLEQQQNEVHHQ